MEIAFDSRARLHHLRDQRERHLSTTRDLGRELADLRAIVMAAQERLQTLKSQPSRVGVFGPTEIAAEAERLQRRIEDLQTEIAEISDRQASAQESWNSAARLLRRCMKFARDRELPIPNSLREEEIHVRVEGSLV